MIVFPLWCETLLLTIESGVVTDGGHLSNENGFSASQITFIILLRRSHQIIDMKLQALFNPFLGHFCSPCMPEAVFNAPLSEKSLLVGSHF